MSRVEFDLVCPVCRGPLEPAGKGKKRCAAEDRVFSRRDGVMSLLTDERFEHYSRFLEEYRTVRRDENRGVDAVAIAQCRWRPAGAMPAAPRPR